MNEVWLPVFPFWFPDFDMKSANESPDKELRRWRVADGGTEIGEDERSLDMIGNRGSRFTISRGGGEMG